MRASCYLLLYLFMSAAATPRHDWNAVHYSFKPLVQKASPNLLPSLENGAKGWELSGDAKVVELGGQLALRLGPKSAKGAAARLKVTVEAQPHTLYRLHWRSKFSLDVRFYFNTTAHTGSYPGLHGWFCPLSPTGTTKGAIRLREWRPGSEWRERSIELYTPADTNRIRFWLDANIIKGSVIIADLSLRKEEVLQAEGRQVLIADSGEWGEATREPEPSAPSRTVVFHRSDPDKVFPFSHPNADEANGVIKLAASPGEVAITTLAMYAAKPLKHVRLDMTRALKTMAWKVVRFHPRRVDGYGRGRTWRWTADVLLDTPEGVDVPAGQTVVFWIKVKLPADTKPGEQNGTIVVRADNMKPVETPVRLRVYPFRLAPDIGKVFGLWGDVGRWKLMTDAQVKAELTDMRSHGINTLMVSCRGKVSVESGRVTEWQFSKFEQRTIPIVLRAGFRRPLLAWFGWMPRDLPTRLGIAQQVHDQTADQWPTTLTQAAIDILRLIKVNARRRGWWPITYVGIDEPGYWKKGSLERLEWDRRVCREAGWKMFCTSSYPPNDPFGRDIEYHCYGLGRFYPGRTEKLIQATHAVGQQVWGYGVGSYTGQKGRLVRNRYLCGFVFYKLGLDGLMGWTFQRPRGNAFDDFGTDCRYSQPCITYPNPWRPGENLDTPHWEAFRQGWIDYRYCRTLSELLARCPEAKETSKRFHSLLASMPWGGNAFDDPRLNNAQLDQWRAQVAALIEQVHP